MANNNNKNTLFDSIFAETYNKLEILNDEISKLQDIYLINKNSDGDSDNKTNKFEALNKMPMSLILYNNNFFISNQTEHFHKIYILYPMCIVIKNKKACEKRYQQIKAITPSKSCLCFLGIIDASINALEFKNGTSKAYLTMYYKFEGLTICQKAWYIIYDI
ncbi:938_t:CDS:2 [Cetraspora pellucida]|uniref:938_t:CDS:1 n=1 Tax=Cetraspora pellucida TaxID=1433469 RepID=A0A9N9IY79_9GLOM|nr:938_t:CDS:2 [Cetraspora pellucida]